MSYIRPMDGRQAPQEQSYTAHMETRWTPGPQLPDEQWQRLLHLLFKGATTPTGRPSHQIEDN